MVKKTLCAAALASVLISNAFAEISANALGVRLGGGTGGAGVALSYQKAMGDANRLELDLGWGGALVVAGAYHWHWNITGGFNWYAGPGALLGVGDDIRLGVGGQIGIELNLNTAGAPLIISIDSRPMFGLLNGAGFGGDGAIAFRYTF